MKIGYRKPSIKKSIKARTTGKLKRKLKKSVNPLYGKKGMGVINNPRKALYNKIYNKTTFGTGDVIDYLKNDSEVGVDINKPEFVKEMDKLKGKADNYVNDKIDKSAEEHPKVFAFIGAIGIIAIVIFIISMIIKVW